MALCVILVGFELYHDIVVKHPWEWSALADIARMVLVLLIASIPVAMPTVMTVTNSLGAQTLARKKAIVAGGHLLLFVMRSRGSAFSRPWPTKPLVLAIVGTQIFAVLMCGFGWFVTALPWTIIGLIWIYMLVWMAVLDGVKLALYSRMRQGAGRPAWYTRFLKGRHPAIAVAQTGDVAQ